MKRVGLVVGIVAIVACARASRQQSGDALGVSDAPGKLADAMPDGNGCSVQPCSILPQCGCATTQTCDINSMTLMGTACRNVVSPGQETSTCTGPGNCDRGYVCLAGSGQSSCKKYCSSTADCGSPRGQCVIDITSGGTPIAGIPPVCSSNCDPTNTTAGGCPASQKCGLYTATHMGTMYDIVDCGAEGAGVQGTACTGAGSGDDTVCAASFLCTSVTAGTYNCRRICNKTTPGTTCGALTCISFNPAFTIAGTEYGVCN